MVKTKIVQCTDLVHRGIFEKLKADFLMVRQTYEDNDQLFSTTSFHLRHTKLAALALLP